MRYTILALLVITIFAISVASPAKDNKQKANPCLRDCGDKYDPICGKSKNTSKERLITFGSECVMANHNCAHPSEPFEVKSRGECGGNVAVLLS